MKIVSAFYVYKLYVSYKAHFSQKSCDISKYGFRPFSISYDTFLKTKGISYYEYIAEHMKSEKNVVSLFISAFIDDPDIWIGDISKNISHYNDLKLIRESRIENMGYIFKQNCIYLMEMGMRFDASMGKFVLYRFLESNIELETFIILKRIFNFNLDNNPNYDYLYRGKYEKYDFLLKINLNKYKQILKEIVMTFGD